VRARKKAIEHGVSILERKGHRGPITEQQARLAVELAEKARPLAKPTSPPKHVGPGRGKKKVNAVGAAKSVSSASSANGTNNEYLTARIARDRPDILERMKAGENANKVVALATVAPAQSPEPPPPGPGRGYKKANPQNEGQLFRNRNTTHAEAERLRAINRAPEPAQDLFRRDLMSKGVAVALGTTKRDTKPEKASVIAEATAAAVSIVESRKPATPAEKRKVRREVDAVVRERLGMERPSTFDRAVAAARVLTINDLRKLRTEIDRLIREGVK
jgi:hypothetical protein